MRTRNAYVYNRCLAWYNVLLIARITQAWNTVNWSIYVKIQLYPLFVVIAIFSALHEMPARTSDKRGSKTQNGRFPSKIASLKESLLQSYFV